MDEQKIETKLVNTGSFDTFKTIQIGEVNIKNAGDFNIHLKPTKKKWKTVKLKSAILSPK